MLGVPAATYLDAAGVQELVKQLMGTSNRPPPMQLFDENNERQETVSANKSKYCHQETCLPAPQPIQPKPQQAATVSQVQKMINNAMKRQQTKSPRNRGQQSRSPSPRYKPKTQDIQTTDSRQGDCIPRHKDSMFEKKEAQKQDFRMPARASSTSRTG